MNKNVQNPQSQKIKKSCFTQINRFYFLFVSECKLIKLTDIHLLNLDILFVEYLYKIRLGFALQGNKINDKSGYIGEDIPNLVLVDSYFVFIFFIYLDLTDFFSWASYLVLRVLTILMIFK